MTEQETLAAETLLSARTVVLASHVNPDGDSLGSSLALFLALQALAKDVTILSTDGVPEIYQWMPSASSVMRTTKRRGFDVAAVCDSGAVERVGSSLRPIVESARVIIDIDHHVQDSPFGDIRVLDSTASSTAELVWDVIDAMQTLHGSSLMNRDIARCLMTGLITDTGSFRFLNVTPRTFRLAAAMQELGAHPGPIAEEVFECRSLASVKLLGRALNSLQVAPGGRVAWARVTSSDFESLGAHDAETEGIVNHVRSIAGVQVGILFREIPGAKVRISMRARAGSDVNRIARVFGGGGHTLAAGCSIEGPLGQVELAVVQEAIRQVSDVEPDA